MRTFWTGGRGAATGSRALFTPARQEEEMEEESGRKRLKQPSLEQCLFTKSTENTKKGARKQAGEEREVEGEGQGMKG